TISKHLSQQKLQEIKSYQKVNYRFGLLTGGISFVLTLLFVGFGIFGELGEWLQEYISHPIWVSMAFFGVFFLGADLLMLPFDYYRTFKIEDDFGFNKTDKTTFFMDKLKGLALTILIGGTLFYV